MADKPILFYDATAFAKGYLMRRKSLSGAACPIARTLDAVGDWWSLLIVRDCLKGMRRFSEFQKSLGVSRNILTQRLRALVAQDILRLAPAVDGSAPNVPGSRGCTRTFASAATPPMRMQSSPPQQDHERSATAKCVVA